MVFSQVVWEDQTDAVRAAAYAQYTVPNFAVMISAASMIKQIKSAKIGITITNESE